MKVYSDDGDEDIPNCGVFRQPDVQLQEEISAQFARVGRTNVNPIDAMALRPKTKSKESLNGNPD